MKGLKKLGALALVAVAATAVVVCVQVAMESKYDEEGRERSFLEKCKTKFF